MNIKDDFVEVNGTRLHFESTGSGPAVVFLHGFSLDMRMWDDQVPLLAQHFQVIRYDLRGFGQSALPTDQAYSHVDDLNALLDRLDLPDAYLVGLSKGGGVVLDFALRFPLRARALVLIDTVLGGVQWSPEASARVGLIWQLGKEAGIPAAKESWLTHPFFAPAQLQPVVAARIAQMIDDYSGWHFVNIDPEYRLEPPAAQRLAELRMPVFALVGEHDIPDFRYMTELVCQQVPQACKLVVPQAGHMANMEAPALVTQAILTFLTKL